MEPSTEEPNAVPLREKQLQGDDSKQETESTNTQDSDPEKQQVPTPATSLQWVSETATA